WMSSAHLADLAQPPWPRVFRSVSSPPLRRSTVTGNKKWTACCDKVSHPRPFQYGSGRRSVTRGRETARNRDSVRGRETAVGESGRFNCGGGPRRRSAPPTRGAASRR